MEKTEDDLKIECIGFMANLDLKERWLEYI